MAEKTPGHMHENITEASTVRISGHQLKVSKGDISRSETTHAGQLEEKTENMYASLSKAIFEATFLVKMKARLIDSITSLNTSFWAYQVECMY